MKKNGNETQKPKQKKQGHPRQQKKKKDHELAMITYLFTGLFALLIPPGIIAVMVWKITQNMSSAIIILGIAMLMIFVASPDYKRFVIMALAGSSVIALAVFAIVKMAESPEMMEKLEFRGLRILAWLNPEAYADGKGFQTLQALYAIGSGGIF